MSCEEGGYSGYIKPGYNWNTETQCQQLLIIRANLQIADAAIEAASAGAAIAHMHVRDLETGKGCRDDELYKEVVSRIKESGTDVIINLTSGMGGDIEIGPEDDLMKFGPNMQNNTQYEIISYIIFS